MSRFTTDRVIEITMAAVAGDASAIPDLEVLAALGSLWCARRVPDPDSDPEMPARLDQAMDALAVEIEARTILAHGSLTDPLSFSGDQP
jgi:hypothetical protein